jgi:uroporphyrin-III C-methyltransferase/precorrin-2 dehydrogenase/sirohydrochlorin ferrochelatase
VLREALERLIGRDVEDWTSLTRQLRTDWRRDALPMDERRDALLAALAHLHEETSTAARAGRHRRKNGDTRRKAPRSSSSVGLVSLVGAGPGDPELLTRRAARRLAEADLVLYDALIAPATLALAKRAQRICVGRRRGSVTMGQEAIVRTLIRAARRGRRVVRLKGGDPFVFGRGGEEALALRAANIPFEVVPGISSAFAAPAAASIPPGTATLVVMMGTERRAEIADALLLSGWRPSTPAAIVRDAWLPEQTVWKGSLATLASAPPTTAPGTIVIGDVVALGSRLSGESSALGREVCHG